VKTLAVSISAGKSFSILFTEKFSQGFSPGFKNEYFYILQTSKYEQDIYFSGGFSGINRVLGKE
jgi:hypothetical protein